MQVRTVFLNIVLLSTVMTNNVLFYKLVSFNALVYHYYADRTQNSVLRHAQQDEKNKKM